MYENNFLLSDQNIITEKDITFSKTNQNQKFIKKWLPIMQEYFIKNDNGKNKVVMYYILEILSALHIAKITNPKKLLDDTYILVKKELDKLKNEMRESEYLEQVETLKNAHLYFKSKFLKSENNFLLWLALGAGALILINKKGK